MSKNYENNRLNTLAKEVAKVFGGTHEPIGQNKEYFEGYADVLIPASPLESNIPAYHIFLRASGWGTKKDELRVSIGPIKKDNDVNERGIEYPSAGFNINRDTQALMAGISKRVVNVAGAAEALREYEKRKKELEDRKTGLQEHLEDVLKSSPNVRPDNIGRSGDTQVRLYSKSGVYLNATLYSDGTMSFDRVSSMSLDQAKRILAILAE